MSTFLLKLLELSLQAGALTLAILLVRLIFRKLPAKYLCLLWAIVAVRLVVPFSFETGFAWAPNLQTMWSGKEEYKYGEIYTELISIEKTQYDSEGNVIEKVKVTESDDAIDYYLNGSSKPGGTVTDVYVELVDEYHTVIPDAGDSNATDYYLVASPTPIPEGTANVQFRLDWRELLGSVTPVLFVLWILGMILLLGYGVFSCIRVKRLVKNAILYEDNIWLCEGLQTPFLFGWRNPQIYLPTNLEEDRMNYVILHEKAHIARGDNYYKLIGYLLLTMYWFNPLIWVAYVMFCKDVERACDERVIGGLDGDGRKGYAEALLECSVDRKFTVSNPLAFGEMDVKKRITGILKYKKPGKWIVAIVALFCVAAVAGCFFVKKEDGENTDRPEVTPTVAADATPTHPPRGDGPYTPIPTPTVAPSSEQRGDGPHTPTPLPPSDLELLGKVTSETVLAVPFGQTVEVDLDGDGKKEKVTIGIERYENGKTLIEAGGGPSGRRNQFYITIDTLEFNYFELYEEYWNDPIGFTTYYIFDVNVKDNYKEIGLYFDGPSGDPSTALYRYIGGKLYCVGAFESATLESDYDWNSDDFEDVPYEEMVQTVDRTEFLVSVPGDGTILCEERTHMFETTYIVREYKLWNASMDKAAELRETIRDRYEFTNWQIDRGELNVRAAKDFYAYLEPLDMSVEIHKDALITKIPEGTRLSFYAYYPDNEWTAGWVQFAYGENLENFAWFYKGVDKTGKFMMYLPDTTESSPAVLFENLDHAG